MVYLRDIRQAHVVTLREKISVRRLFCERNFCEKKFSWIWPNSRKFLPRNISN